MHKTRREFCGEFAPSHRPTGIGAKLRSQSRRSPCDALSDWQHYPAPRLSLWVITILQHRYYVTAAINRLRSPINNRDFQRNWVAFYRHKTTPRSDTENIYVSVKNRHKRGRGWFVWKIAVPTNPNSNQIQVVSKLAELVALEKWQLENNCS